MLDNACEGDAVQISLDVTYTESDSSVAIKFSCAGKSYDPLDKNFDDFDEENLGAVILRSLVQNYSYEYTAGVNNIKFTMT